MQPMALPADLPPQELAGRLPGGNLCVLGGPGSGKTALLEALMLQAHVGSDGSGLLLVPSRQAAEASTARLLAASPSDASSALGAVTWHQFARGLVAGHADLLGYRGEPRPLSGADQWSLVRAMLLETSTVDWGPLAPLVTTRAFTDELADLLLACERRLLGPEDLAARALDDGRAAWTGASRFFAAYEERLALDDSIDHAGLLAQAGDLLAGWPDVRSRVAAGIGTLLADEAQELDPAQLRILRSLAGAGVRLVAAGDPLGVTDAVRGTDTDLLAAHAAALGARLVLLPGSRRLGGPALEAARRLRRPGNRPHRPPDAPGQGPDAPAAPGGPERDAGGFGDPLAAGGPPTHATRLEVLQAAGRAEEADAVARLLRLAHQHDGVPYGRMGVLLASRQLGPPVTGALDRLGVPHRLGAGEGMLVDEPAVRTVLDLFRLALDSQRAEELLPSLLTSFLGGLDPHDLRALRRAAVVADRPLAALLDELDGATGLPARARRRAGAFRALLGRARGWVRLDADRAFWELWRTAPAFRRLVARVTRDPADAAAQRRLDALVAFSQALGLFVDGRPGATIATWLDGAGRADLAGDPWLRPSPVRGDAVSVLGLNAARGHEFDLVVVVGCQDGALPRTAWPEGVFEPWRLDGDLDPVARAGARLDFERRRFTLALTRARDRVVCTLSRSEGRQVPSRFLAEAGVEPVPAAGRAPLTPLEAAGVLRRVLADRGRDAAQRVAAAVSLARMPDVDPGGWWWSRAWTSDPGPIVPEGRLRTSYTRIGVYEDCHLRYFYSSVAGLDDRASYRMEFGKLMHTIFELAATGRIGDTPPELKAAFRERFRTAWFPSLAVAHQFWRDGLVMLRYWYEGEAELARRALAAEVGFEIEVGRHVVRGRIDRVDRAEPADDGGIILLDYKTARTVPTEAQAANSLQLAIYFLAALRDPELAALGEPVEMQLVYPAEQRQGRFRRVVQRPGPEYAAAVEQRLLPLLDGAAAEQFDPNPHADCRFCSFKPICPMWPQGEDFLAPPRATVADRGRVPAAGGEAAPETGGEAAPRAGGVAAPAPGSGP